VKKSYRVLALILCLVFGSSFLFATSQTVYAEDNKLSNNQTQDFSDPENEYLSITVSNDAVTRGRFSSGSTGTATGKEYEILNGWPNEIWSSFTTIKVDNNDYIFGQPEGGTFIKPPTDGVNLTNETIWKIGNVEITQWLQIVNNPSTGRKDTGMYKYIIKNTDTVPHDVGTRILLDTHLRGRDDRFGLVDRAKISVPGLGEVTKERTFEGNSIPEYYQVFTPLNEPDVAARGMLLSEGEVRPDKFAVCHWETFFDTKWDYTTDGNKSIEGDSSVGIWWNPITLQPGASKEFITYYGLGPGIGNSSLSITGPSELQIEENTWSPNPFTVTASLSHDLESPLINVPVELILPEGLVLASSDDSLSRTIPSIESGKTEQISWQVRAIRAGTWEYTINAFTNSNMKKTAKQTVIVPEIEMPLDTLPPTTSHISSPLPNSNGWSNTDVKVKLSSLDNQGGSGVYKIFYNITNNGQTQNKEFQGPSVEFTLNSEGITKVGYKASDRSGNLEDPKIVDYKIDKTKPEININISKTDYNKLTDTLEIDFNAADEISGLDSLEAFLGDMKVTSGQKILLSESGTLAGNQQLKVTAKDNAGNVTVKTLDIFIQVPAAGLALSPKTLTLEEGKAYTLTYTINPENTTYREVVWSSSNSNVARIENGKVTAVSKGEATITVTTKDGLYNDTCKVKVIDKGNTLPETGSRLALLQPLGILLILIGILMAFKRKPQ
jgi:hypothetical protein